MTIKLTEANSKINEAMDNSKLQETVFKSFNEEGTICARIYKKFHIFFHNSMDGCSLLDHHFE